VLLQCQKRDKPCRRASATGCPTPTLPSTRVLCPMFSCSLSKCLATEPSPRSTCRRLQCSHGHDDLVKTSRVPQIGALHSQACLLPCWMRLRRSCPAQCPVCASPCHLRAVHYRCARAALSGLCATKLCVCATPSAHSSSTSVTSVLHEGITAVPSKLRATDLLHVPLIHLCWRWPPSHRANPLMFVRLLRTFCVAR
jgi:hypothetical protein